MEPLRQLKSGTSFLSTYTCDPASPGTWGSAYPAGTPLRSRSAGCSGVWGAFVWLFPSSAMAADGAPFGADGWEIGYVTDVEGNLAHFRRYVRLSRVLRFTDKAETKLELLPNKVRVRAVDISDVVVALTDVSLLPCGQKMFVFGGDVCDRGCGDLRISRMLVELKKRHMDRVVLILGNRDINKTRFTSELHAAEVTRPASLHQGGLVCVRCLVNAKREPHLCSQGRIGYTRLGKSRRCSTCTS